MGDFEGVSKVPPWCLQRSVSGALNWKRENDVQDSYSVMEHYVPALIFCTTSCLMHYIVVLLCLYVFLPLT